MDKIPLQVLLPHVSFLQELTSPVFPVGARVRRRVAGLPSDGPLMLGIVYTYMYTRTINRESTNHEIVSVMFVCISVCVG